MPGRLWYKALATPGDAPGPREAAVLSLLRTLPQLPSPSPPAAALTHSNPLLPFTFTQHPEGEELPPPFPSSAPGPAPTQHRAETQKPAPRLKTTLGAIVKLQGGAVPAMRVPLCLSNQNEPTTNLDPPAPASPPLPEFWWLQQGWEKQGLEAVWPNGEGSELVVSFHVRSRVHTGKGKGSRTKFPQLARPSCSSRTQARSRKPVPADTTFRSGGGGAAATAAGRVAWEGFPAGAAPGWAGAARKLRSCTNTAGWLCTGTCGRGVRAAEGAGGRAANARTQARPPPRPLGQQKLPRRAPRGSAPPLRAAPAELQPAPPAATACAQPGVPWPPQPGRALRRAACRPRPPAQQPHLPCSYPSSGIGCPLSAAGRRLRSPPRLQPPARTPDFKNKQAPPPPRDARRISASSRLPRPGSLLAGPGRDARAVTPRSRHRSLGATRARGVRLAIALPPSVSPPSPPMQCQDCTALTHRLSSQLEKKKERERGREATAKEEDSLACYKGLHNSGLGARSAQQRAGARGTAASRNQLYHFISTTVSGLPLSQQARRRPLPETK
ncbi:nascent polypeptide-associated complex subunit alpha, muscle-specific form-like [Orcinus orca]|uniref:nascent polypeptide-associated complex subunit alpha, muscle-specific form-like n=1 Tax=Orcinus orca TaxID=9733 RepID=UPI002112DEE0|nr:nascent polypeptide-associated complex subunit alpha, muscle-specific form-like [Orcinus orca]